MRCDRSSMVERLPVKEIVVGSIPIGHPNYGWVAQMVERLAEAEKVAGSLPAPATTSI